MITGNTHIRLVGAVAALLLVAAVGARAAQARPDSWKLHYLTEAAQAMQASQSATSQTQVPDAFERAVNARMNAPYPDVFERAAARGPSGLQTTQVDVRQPDSILRPAVSDVRQPDSILPPVVSDVRAPDSVQPQLPAGTPSAPTATDGSGDSFDWGLLALVSALCAGIGAVGGAVLITARHRERVAHP
jgi:hypothetical protein